jgi:hypothetical protein
VVLAIAEALMVHRTLDAAMIDDIISRAPERVRRADWLNLALDGSRPRSRNYSRNGLLDYEAAVPRP